MMSEIANNWCGRPRVPSPQLWHVSRDSAGDPMVQHTGTIRDSQMTTVNCVRWSPTGLLLAF